MVGIGPMVKPVPEAIPMTTAQWARKTGEAERLSWLDGAAVKAVTTTAHASGVRDSRTPKAVS